MKPVQYLVIHDSDSAYGNPFMIDAWHKERGFLYKHVASNTPIHVGYHYLILNGRLYSSAEYLAEWDGIVVPCRPEDAVGAHCLANGRNEDSLGICLIGNGVTFTHQQLVSLADLCFSLTKKYKIPADKIVGHKEQDSKKSDPRIDMQALRYYISQR